MSLDKTPVIGKLASGEVIKSFRARKLDLKERGYPARETRQLVRELFEMSVQKWEGLFDSSTILIKVPSGSGENKVTQFFAKELQKRFGVDVLEDGHVMRLHRLEAKRNLSLEKRISDPIGYTFYDPKAFMARVEGKTIVVVDDLIASGESSIKLKKTLEAHGLPVKALVNLVTVENRYPSVKDIGRFVEKVASQRKLSEREKENLWKDASDVFADYTRQKLNRVERQVTGEMSAAGAYEVIKRAAVIERKFTTDLQQQNNSKQRSTQLSI